ncbi:MAG: hypothetical protein ACTSQL_12070, partial [Promethearchaeota archaeon]
MNKNLRLRLGFLLIFVAILTGVCITNEVSKNENTRLDENFTPSTSALPPPNRLNPYDEQALSSKNVEFNWLPTGGAIAYELQVASDTNFNNIIESKLMGSTSWSKTFSTYGIYYWRMRTMDTSGFGSWSSTWSFSISLPLVAPNRINPSDNDILTSRTVYFEWDHVNNAKDYQIYVYFYSTGIGSYFYTSNNYYTLILGEGSYTWKLRTRNEYGLWGAWNANWGFIIATVPDQVNLYHPYYDDTFYHRDISLRWWDVSEALQYELQVSRNTGFNTLIQNPSFILDLNLPDENSHDFEILFPSDGSFFWRVRAQGFYGEIWGPWSYYNKINIETIPEIVQLKNPPNGDTVYRREDIRFQWWDDSRAIQYEFQVASDPQFTFLVRDPIMIIDLDPPYEDYHELSLSFSEDGTYYWRVRATSVYGDSGPWSSYRWFYVDTIPDRVQLRAPSDGDTVYRREDIYLSWWDVYGAVQYELQVARDSSFGIL